MEETSKTHLTPTEVPSPTPAGELRQMAPGKIWAALTMQQQEQFYQRLVSICYHLSNGSSVHQEEVSYERH